ncbi:uncharacterized protein CIMG_07175 [Coccidioides immitis RS]|uniref:Essential protein Yae1 N-terminal domain-containing protein n=1 Tax=Coccidioides immitis (strain RS) TaxID=246410 RepID=J3K9S4_COCIM|nr:uncharacterized protein CIMG_07175 [Coccidioides immitis RS]EAS31696.3 hypothetical protein CIMG_07175 [Coccidioides immitis RS]
MDIDSLLDLEETFYAEGYELGFKDGEVAGYNEGCVFAVENGFEKFQEMGRLYGKGIIWAKRLPGNHGLLHASKSLNGAAEGAEAVSTNTPDRDDVHLPDLPPNPRLEKHLAAFLSLVDPLTLSMENAEEAVAEFDERLKKATAKAKIIEKLLGETRYWSASAENNTRRLSLLFANLYSRVPLQPLPAFRVYSKTSLGCKVEDTRNRLGRMTNGPTIILFEGSMRSRKATKAFLPGNVHAYMHIPPVANKHIRKRNSGKLREFLLLKKWRGSSLGKYSTMGNSLTGC